jgi:phage minor structural protein
MEVISVRPVLYAEDNTNYSHNGIGILYDALTCEVYEENNGIFDCELEYPVDGEWADEIIKGCQILAKPNDIDDPHAFRIYEVEKDLEQGIIFARATSITDDLAANLIKHVVVTDATPQQALDAIKADLIEPTMFDFISDIQTRSSSEWTRINPLQAFVGTDGSLIDIWGGEVKRSNNTIYLYSRRGKDRVTTIRPGKNIDGFNMVVSTKGMITKILPFYTYTPESLPEYELVQDSNGNWVKQEKYGSTTVNTQQEQQTILGDVVVSDNASKYAVNYYSPIDFSSNAYIQDQVSAYIQAKKDADANSPDVIDNSGWNDVLHDYILGLLNQEASGYFIYNNPGCDEPSIQIKADMVELSDSPEWQRYKDLERIQVSDTVDVYVKQFNVDVEVAIKSIKYDAIGERVVDITAGNPQTSLTQSQTRTYETKTKQIEEYISTLEYGVYNTINRTANGQAKRFSGYTEPPADISSEGDLWFKELGNGNVEIYMYSGGIWAPKVTGAEVMQRLVALGIDARDVTIVNLDASSITGGNLEVTNTFRIMHNGTPVLEVDANTGQVKITAPNLATQEDLTNIELTPGPAGADAWYTEIISSNGNIFRSGTINTVLEARVYKGGIDVTDSIPIQNFKWTRVSQDATGDTAWNNKYFGGVKSITLTPEDVYRKATFFCVVTEP